MEGWSLAISDLRLKSSIPRGGVGCQVSGVREKNKKTETCWSEAEIPSEAKRQRETLKP